MVGSGFFFSTSETELTNENATSISSSIVRSPTFSVVAGLPGEAIAVSPAIPVFFNGRANSLGGSIGIDSFALKSSNGRLSAVGMQESKYISRTVIALVRFDGALKLLTVNRGKSDSVGSHFVPSVRMKSPG